MTLHDTSEKFIAIHENSWCFMTNHDNSWQITTSFDNSWRLMNIWNDLWKFTKNSRHLRKILTDHDNSTQFMNINEDKWEVMTIPEDSSRFTWVHIGSLVSTLVNLGSFGFTGVHLGLNSTWSTATYCLLLEFIKEKEKKFHRSVLQVNNFMSRVSKYCGCAVVQQHTIFVLKLIFICASRMFEVFYYFVCTFANCSCIFFC